MGADFTLIGLFNSSFLEENRDFFGFTDGKPVAITVIFISPFFRVLSFIVPNITLASLLIASVINLAAV